MTLPTYFEKKYDEKLELLRRKAKTDQLWLANEVLGYDFQETPHRGLFNCYLPKDPEKGLYEQDLVKKCRLILWPRGHFKTTASAVEIVQLILNFPDIRILILSANVKEGKKRLAEVKQQFERGGNPKLRKLFPEFCSDKKVGTREEFVSPARKRKHLREATVAVASPRTIKTGSHYDVIFVDDLVNEQNYKKKELLQKAIDDYKACVPVLEPEGYIYVTGTRYSLDDAYGWIQDQMKREGVNRWLVSIRTCWISRCKHCDHPDVRHLDGGGACGVGECSCKKFESNGVLETLFPQTQTPDGRTIGFTVERLQAIKAEAGEEFFACQYENNPLAGSFQKFTRELLYSHVLPVHMIPQMGPVIFVVDLAFSNLNESDETVIYVSRIRGGRHYIIDCVGQRLDPDQQKEWLVSLLLKYRPVKIYLEHSVAAEYLLRMLIAHAVQNQIYNIAGIVEILPQDNRKNAKYHRIDSIKNVLKEDRLYFSAGLPHWDILENQLLGFPKRQRHDDYADTVGLVVNAPTGYENVPLAGPPQPFWLGDQKQQDTPPQERLNGLPFGING